VSNQILLVVIKRRIVLEPPGRLVNARHHLDPVLIAQVCELRGRPQACSPPEEVHIPGTGSLSWSSPPKPLGVGTMPVPRGLNHPLWVFQSGFPSQFFPYPCGGCHQPGRISGSPFSLHSRYGTTRYPSCDLDDLQHGVAVLAAQVVEK